MVSLFNNKSLNENVLVKLLCRAKDCLMQTTHHVVMNTVAQSLRLKIVFEEILMFLYRFLSVIDVVIFGVLARHN